MSEDRRFAGTIKSFNPDKGWGHIDCAETKAIYGKDIFFMRSQLNGASVSKGDSVFFKLKQGEKGVEANDVLVSARADPSSAAAAAGGVDSTERFVGTVKSCDSSGNWGHIKCDRTQLIYGKDIFLLRSDAADGVLRQGVTVEFSVRQGQKGPEAFDVNELSGFENPDPANPEAQPELSPALEQAAAQQLAAGFAGFTQSPDSLALLQAQIAATTQAAQAQASLGQAVQAQAAQTWAAMLQPQQIFQPHDASALAAAYMTQQAGVVPGVTMSALPPSMAIPSMGLLGYGAWPGASISAAALAANAAAFGLTVGASVATDTDILLETAGLTEKDIMGKAFEGTVKSYDDDRGWGHVNCPETRRILGKDMFMLRSAIMGGSGKLKVGDRVRFTVQPGLKGPEAQDISVIDTSVRVAPY